AATTPGAVKLLAASGADVNAQADNGWTALMAAASQNAAGMVRALLSAGADPALKNAKSETAAAIARADGYAAVGRTIEAASAAASKP
ncbi:MAG: ankyrin repeat domain-containing protein, partial [Elusimicrobia bacterium]|nr:ankyrin repeat domain-containing protein [Elusimicrobiota bacterium]